MKGYKKTRRELEIHYFEKWAAEQGYNIDKFRDGSYVERLTEELWGSWLARARKYYVI